MRSNRGNLSAIISLNLLLLQVMDLLLVEVSIARSVCYEDELEKETREDYTLIHSGKHFKIYHLKNTDTDEDP
jgi:hypothetical protein